MQVETQRASDAVPERVLIAPSYLRAILISLDARQC